jgi:uncharacterized membrane protein YcaP (DUF421 family)
LDGEPKYLVKNGFVDLNLMKQEQITEQELFEGLRQQGVDDLKKVKLTTLETNGHLSVIEKAKQRALNIGEPVKRVGNSVSKVRKSQPIGVWSASLDNEVDHGF